MPNLALALLNLGVRGIPDAFGRFETFAERPALRLVRRRGHGGVTFRSDVRRLGERVSARTRGIDLTVPEAGPPGPVARPALDAFRARDSARRATACGAIRRALGCDGAAFPPYLPARGARSPTDMDGIEGRRPRWPRSARAFLDASERIAARPVADHPDVADTPMRRPAPRPPAPPPTALVPGRTLVSIAGIEPDDDIPVIVETFSRRPRGGRLRRADTLGAREAEARGLGGFPPAKAILPAASQPGVRSRCVPAGGGP